MAGRQHLTHLRADRRILRSARARGEGHRRRRRSAWHQRHGPDLLRAALARRDCRSRGRSLPSIEALRAQGFADHAPVGTTKPTIIAIRERSHWNSPNLQAQDPVTLGLCSQIDLDAEVKKAAVRLERERKEAGIVEQPKAGTLLPAEEALAAAAPRPEPEAERPMATALAQEARAAMAAPDEEEEGPDVDSVFAKLKELKRTDVPSE